MDTIFGQPASGSFAASSAAAVGNEFLSLGRLEPSAPPIDQMKLQKLLFYAHAWHLALKDTPLFEEDFEAWPWGPVVRNIYFQTKNYGKFPVVEPLTEIAQSGSGPFGFATIIPQVANPETKRFIKEVWDLHKSFTGVQLSNATHAPGEPWTVIRDHYGNLDQKPTIPNHLIRDIFRAKVNNGNAASN